ncbi:MAG: OmpA family protein, partial [Bacteroidota bacterium]|nr:OmpA family protein [Bacteroidota bacterium]
MQYKGELGNQFNKFSAYKNVVRVFLSRYLDNSFEGIAELGLNGLDKSGEGKYSMYNMDGHIFSGDVGIRYKFNNGYVIPEDFIVQPYLVFGMGAMLAKTKGYSMIWNAHFDQTRASLTYHYGLGTKVRLTQNMSAFIDVADYRPGDKRFDQAQLTTIGDKYRIYCLGVVYSFGNGEKGQRKNGALQKDKGSTLLGLKNNKAADERTAVAKPTVNSVVNNTSSRNAVPKSKESEFVLEPILFKANSYEIPMSENGKMENVINILKDNLTIKLVIAGHADETGTLQYNEKLSQDRAEKVYNYLLTLGVDKSRISKVVYYGSKKPAVAGDSPEALSKNRRVEFELSRD